MITIHRRLHSLSLNPFCLLKSSAVFLTLTLVLSLTACSQNSPVLNNNTAENTAPKLVLGAERLDMYLPMLRNKRIGLVVNQTSHVGEQHLLDILLSHGIDVKVLFAPEHGVRGNKGAGEHIESSKDAKTQVPIQSIYGANKHPPDKLMQTLDLIVFDIQDVGTRFYTYISSMHYMMAAAAKHGLEFMVLDRPNPNGKFVDGPVLEPEFQSFVGMHPIPILHGLSVGELALMIKGEEWIEQANKLSLTVIAMENYHKSYPYSLPIPPSPNLPNSQAIQLYPSLCFFEATAVSVGRGTDFPFQVIGHNQVKLGDFTFTPEPRPNAAPNPKLKGQSLFGENLQASEIEGLQLDLFIQTYHQFNQAGQTFFTSESFMDKLAGTQSLRLAIMAGQTSEQIKQTWQAGLSNYKQMREPYLLYPLEQ